MKKSKPVPGADAAQVLQLAAQDFACFCLAVHPALNWPAHQLPGGPLGGCRAQLGHAAAADGQARQAAAVDESRTGRPQPAWMQMPEQRISQPCSVRGIPFRGRGVAVIAVQVLAAWRTHRLSQVGLASR